MVGEAGDLSASRDPPQAPCLLAGRGFSFLWTRYICRQRRDSLSAMGYCAYCFGGRLCVHGLFIAITPQILVLGLGALFLLVVTLVVVGLTLRS